MAKIVFVLFIVGIVLTAFVLAKDKPSKTAEEDPKKSLENLGMFFKMMSAGGNGSCAFTCPGGAVPLPKPGHIPSSNGCGSMGITLDTSLFPGFTPCCGKHDKCYDRCNSDRDKCDDVFQECIEDVCRKFKGTQSADRIAACENAGGVMHTAARGLGCSSFKQAQEKACVCPTNIIDHEIDDEDEENKEFGNSDNDDQIKRPGDEDFDKIEL